MTAAGILDAAILTTAAAILSWTFLMEPQIAGTDLDPLSLGIGLSYPIADLILIGVAMGLLATPGARTASFLMLAASLGCVLVADEIYAIQALDQSYVSGSLLDSLYLASYILFGASALHPSMRRLTEPNPVPGHLARPGPRDRVGRGHDHRARAGGRRSGRRRHAARGGDRHPPCSRCSSSHGSSAWSACWRTTLRNAGRSRRSSASRPSMTR